MNIAQLVVINIMFMIAIIGDLIQATLAITGPLAQFVAVLQGMFLTLGLMQTRNTHFATGIAQFAVMKK